MTRHLNAKLIALLNAWTLVTFSVAGCSEKIYGTALGDSDVWSGGGQEGGRADDGSVEAGGDERVSKDETQPCIEEASPLEENEATKLGFSAADVLAFVEGVHEAELIWRDGTKTALTFTVTAISASYVSSVGNPEYVSYETVYCEDYIALTVSSTFVTEDGKFNETWESHVFKSKYGDWADTVLTMERDEIAGSYSPETSSDQCFFSLQLDISLSPDFFSGSSRQIVAGAACDAIQPSTGVGIGKAASWNSSSE